MAKHNPKIPGATPKNGKLTKQSLEDLKRARSRVLTGRTVVTRSTETLRRFREGGTSGTNGTTLRPSPPPPSRQR